MRSLESLPGLVRDCRNTMTGRTKKDKKLHHAVVDRQLRENLATLFNLLFVLSSRRRQLIRNLAVFVNVQNVGLLLKHSSRGETTAVYAVVVVRIRSLQFLELLGVLRLDTFPLLMIWVAT